MNFDTIEFMTHIGSGTTAIVPSNRPLRQLEAELAAARAAMQQAEALLAEEQAAVNAFRMHCRLMLDDLVDEYQSLQAEKQRLWTRLQLCRQAWELGVPFEEDDPFWQNTGGEEQPPRSDDPLLPTDTPNDKAAEKRLYRELARRFHPDLGMTALETAYRTQMMMAINNAYNAGDNQALYDLAGELDPNELADLALIEDVEARKCRQQTLKCRRLRRKAVRRLQSLRQENTARLWQKAQQLENAGKDPWCPVREEIDSAIRRRQAEIDDLQAQIEAIMLDEQTGES